MGASLTFIKIIQIIISVYDLLTGWIYFIFTRPNEKIKGYHKIRAVPTKPISEGDTEATFTPLKAEKVSPIIRDFEAADSRTMAEVWSWAVERYGARRFLGTRDILGEDDEIQPNGRIFSKLILGDYR